MKRKVYSGLLILLFILTSVTSVAAEDKSKVSFNKGDVFKYSYKQVENGEIVIDELLEITIDYVNPETGELQYTVVHNVKTNVNTEETTYETTENSSLSIGNFFTYSDRHYWKNIKEYASFPGDISYTSFLGTKFIKYDNPEILYVYGSNGILNRCHYYRTDFDELSTIDSREIEIKLQGIKSILISVGFKLSVIFVFLIATVSFLYFKYLKVEVPNKEENY